MCSTAGITGTLYVLLSAQLNKYSSCYFRCALTVEQLKLKLHTVQSHDITESTKKEAKLAQTALRQSLRGLLDEHIGTKGELNHRT